MNIFRSSLLVSMSVCALMASSVSMAAEPSAEPSAVEIAHKFDAALRLTHKPMFLKFKLSTCKYKVKNSRMRCTEKPRVTIFENVLKYFGEDMRSAAIILEPARDKGIGSLTFEFEDSNVDNSSWIYLSALGKVKRIVTSKESEDSGSFFGSEMSIEDFEERRLHDYTYKSLGTDTLKIASGKKYEQRASWILEWTPTAQRATKSRYSKVVSWIDQERHVLLKEEYYDDSGKLIKKRTVKNYEQIGEVWIARNVTMNNLASKRVTNMARKEVALDVEIDDEFLEQRALTDFAFRERYLGKYRNYLKQ